MQKIETKIKAILDNDKNNSSCAKHIIDLLKVQPEVQELNFWPYQDGIPIGARGAQVMAEVLKENQTVRKLTLTKNDISDKEVKMLSEALRVNQTLHYLELGGNLITCNGAKVLSEALKVNQTLSELYLRRNKIGDQGVEALSEALKLNRGLSVLDLTDCSFDTIGAKALSDALRITPSLKHLYLTENLSKCDKYSHEGYQALVEGIRSNSSLSIYRGPGEVNRSYWGFFTPNEKKRIDFILRLLMSLSGMTRNQDPIPFDVTALILNHLPWRMKQEEKEKELFCENIIERYKTLREQQQKKFQKISD
jgi:hypothetical protein